jgi:hypothetical protein
MERRADAAVSNASLCSLQEPTTSLQGTIMTQATTWTVLILCGLFLTASNATAQDIIRFDDQAGGTGSPIYPGAPTPAARSGESAPMVNNTPSKNNQDDGNYSETTVFQQPQGTNSVYTDELLRKEPKEIYSGIIPGKRDEVKHIDAKQKAGEIKWIGFLAEKTRTRVFVQTSGIVNYETNRHANKLILTFLNSSLAAKNFSRHIDTRFYSRPVKMIQTKDKKRNKKVEIMLTLENADEPSIEKQGEYVYIDFKHSSSSK